MQDVGACLLRPNARSNIAFAQKQKHTKLLTVPPAFLALFRRDIFWL